ncbi:hypothetical protein M407DRAFT_14294 [Tulasnella calospora MUT 4182]|uniref:HECT-type E3 ubiquitin transferase n=1 Tax=Tulasnella calospora MUT 4182 TaxID=1051891 RepID=A0A0C3QG76_9AGAM|nr:hypothetical protein M407DRAFT_14294 [Tulasnella calospora MUT 4182]
MRDGEAGSGDDYDDQDDDNHDDDESHDEVMDDGTSNAPPSSDAPPGAAAALFGSDFRSIGSYMMTLSSRLKTILENIKPKADPTTRLIALQELAELLSISTEDTLSGYFSIDSFVKELVRIMGGTGNNEDGDDGDDDNDGDESPDVEQDEDAALAAALAMSTGGMPGEESLEAQMLACRCLANLMEALPGCAHTVVYHGAVPVLCSKLIEIQYIDLAEQTLSTLEKISEEYPSAIVREGGLSALLNYLDFFSTNVQRTALQAASNCCRNASSDSFPQIREVFPIIRNVLSYSDQRLVEYACQCVIRVIESFHRSSPDHLDSLMDAETVRAINLLLLPAGGSPLIGPSTYTSLLRVLASAAKSSAKTTIALLEADVVSTLHQILTGVLPPTHDDGTEQGDAPGGQGLGGGVADMAVMENLAHRPKDQVEEGLSLLCELLPPLPKDGVFDSRAYTEKSLAKMIKAKGKADRAAARAATASAGPSTLAPAPVTAPEDPATDNRSTTPNPDEPADSQASLALDPLASDALPPPSATVENTKEKEKDKTAARIELLKEKGDILQKFMRSMVPILVDVYAASVALQVRTRSITGLLKAINWMEPNELKMVLKNVPMASFIGSILSTKDNPSLIAGALQLVELLLIKLPQQYRSSFRREGVLHEIEIRAAQDLTTAKAAKSTPQPTAIPIPVIPAAPGDSSTPVPAAASIPIPIPTGIAAEDVPTTGASTPAVEPTSINPPVLPFDGLPPSSILAAVLPTPVKRSSSSSLDPQDAIILRCRIIRFKYLMTPAHGQGDDPLESMQALGRRLVYGQASETEIKRTLSEVAALFGSNGSTSVSSFELMKSGLVDELLEFATAEGRKVSLPARQRLLLEAFTTRSTSGTASPSSQIPLAILVKRLQESLTRLENFEVVTVSQGEDSKRGSAQMLARQLRLRLVAADGTTVPRNCTNITVSIHAIATFQALHDYLRPRVAGVGPGASGISGVLAAFAAAAGIPSSALSGRRPIPLSGSALAASMPPPQPSTSSGPSIGSPPAPIPASAASAPPAAEPSQPSRRRSLRLRKEAPQEPSATETSGSGSNTGATPAAAPPAASPALAFPPDAASQAALADLMDSDDLADDYVGDDFDDEIVDENPTPANERTVSLAVADDGQRVEAQTPQGTRVATPNPAAATAPTPSPPKTSYATALKAKPTDWHLEFSMDDHPLPLDMTVYGAVHQNVMRKEATVPPLSTLWNNIYTVKFKKVPGPVPVEGASDTASTERAASPMTTSAPDDAPHSKILRLLRVFYKLNTQGSERLMFDRAIPTLPESAFINNKLTAKLTRQLEEPMIVASSCLPDWALDLPQHYPFLFPFATRFSFLQSTSFGYARLILKWQSQQSRSSENNSRRDDAFGYLGRLQRQKVRISRKFLLESAIKVLELYGSSSSVLEVEYFDEVGTGLGPTLEFYSLVSREFARKNIKMWHDADPAGSDPYVSHPTGLYPAPLSRKEISEISSGSGKKRTDIFKLLGQFIAKALLDSRIIDISLNKLFLKFILGEEVPVSISSLKLVDPALAQSLLKLQAFIDMKRDIEANMTLNPAAKRAALANLEVDGTKLEDLTLDFTLPGYDIELRDNGKDISVDATNIEDYLREVLETFVGRGVQVQAQAFREGFSKVFPVTDLQSFSAEELSMMFGNAEEDWSIETLNESIKADHGFNIDSRAIRNLIEVMASYDGPGRRAYLQFITGSPRLPVGGFRGLNPPLTVVRKPHEHPLRPDDYLPSVMTCVNYLKLPEYSSREVMKQKLNTAMKEGVGSFHLS